MIIHMERFKKSLWQSKCVFSSVGAFDIVTAAIAGVFLFALYTVFQIPGYYKYGSIKGRVFMYIPVAGFLVTLLLLSKMPAIGNSIISVVESSPILLVLLAVFAIVVMYAVSIFLSIRVMKNKEMWGDCMDFTILAVVLLIGVGVPIRNKLIRKYRDKKKNDRNSEWTIWRKQSSSAAQSAGIKHATKFGKIPYLKIFLSFVQNAKVNV